VECKELPNAFLVIRIRLHDASGKLLGGSVVLREIQYPHLSSSCGLMPARANATHWRIVECFA
jgi:hypothetical protein